MSWTSSTWTPAQWWVCFPPHPPHPSTHLTPPHPTPPRPPSLGERHVLLLRHEAALHSPTPHPSTPTLPPRQVSGTKFYYLKNEAALLELALVNYAMQKVVRRGFTPMITPGERKREVGSWVVGWVVGGM